MVDRGSSLLALISPKLFNTLDPSLCARIAVIMGLDEKGAEQMIVAADKWERSLEAPFWKRLSHL